MQAFKTQPVIRIALLLFVAWRLGAVGDGAHASHEFIEIDRLAERCALLTLLLLTPPLAASPTRRINR